ncbi:MAG: helix-turn-helix domain-containing protein [Clostridiales Family XIII bacterium]|jgi:AraC-like DNA-binding protein/mannose-6-phosphate isomerase-like protein (cupin superfamily)|nr:helix-turn-helix domain-containing protein [Clostridiales Family XIII bacterium]
MRTLDDRIQISKDEGYNAHVVSLGYSSCHKHEGILEIVVVLSGYVFAHVSFENFYLEAGDYIAINSSDPHFLQNATIPVETAIANPTSVQSLGEVKPCCKDDETESIVVVLHIDLDAYADVSPHLKFLLFTLESFDLARYKHQENHIRRMIVRILCADRERECALPLMELLVREYTSQSYYNRNAYMTEEKQRKYFKIIEIMSKRYSEKDVLSTVAKNMFYSKSYILHLFKEIGTSSFPDILTFYRIAAAEKLLLSTDMKLDEMSTLCGFSDVKYLIRDFRKWFSITPGQYRKAVKPLVQREPDMRISPIEQFKRQIRAMTKIDGEDRPTRFSVNPISLKSI